MSELNPSLNHTEMGIEPKSSAEKPIGGIDGPNGEYGFYVEDHSDNLNLMFRGPDGRRLPIIAVSTEVENGHVVSRPEFTELGRHVFEQVKRDGHEAEFDKIMDQYLQELPGLTGAYEERIRNEFNI